MKTVHKYQLPPVGDIVTLRLPKFARPLCVQTQRGEPCLWAIVDPNNETEERKFRIAGTGHELGFDDVELVYIDTFQLFEGAFIGHVFEIVQ